jgi:two-component system chemotaxis response regulator CheB
MNTALEQAPRPLRVLVVDDSATVRQALSVILGRDRTIEVTTAADPIFALAKMERQRPDVIVTDIEMPRMDGLTFLRRVMAKDPIPTIICSALTGVAADLAIRALEEGAMSVVTKPRLGVKQFLEESAVTFIDEVRGAAMARRGRRTKRRSVVGQSVTSAPRPPKESPSGSLHPRELGVTTQKVVAIGASIGGTEALRTILEDMPPDCPGIVIVQHMPEAFTRAFAQRLDQTCRIEVKEAQDGDRVINGRALIAPGNRHLRLQRTGGHYCVEVTDGPLVSRHRPSVDVLFCSAATAAGGNAVGVLLTGMGDDGARGLGEMRQAGAPTIAQDEATCVVFGMPREAILLGAVDEVVPLPEISQRMLRRAGSLQLVPRVAVNH